MVMKRNEEISIRAGRAVEKLALDLLDRKSTESILVEFNTPPHAFKVSPVRVSDNDAAAAQERLAQKLRDVRFNSDWSFLPPSAFTEVLSEAEFDRELRERAEYRAKNWYSLWHSGQMSFQEAEQHRTTNAALRAADNMVEPIPDEKLAEAHEPAKCLDKPIYYFASNDYKAVQAWAEKYGLPDWNRAKIGFDYPPNAVVIPFYKENHDMEGFAEVVLQVADADKRGVKMIAPGRLARALIVAAFWDGNANL